jgi:DNA-directed RNA polymerase subunit M/transcription elongation factor TFIIS
MEYLGFQHRVRALQLLNASTDLGVARRLEAEIYKLSITHHLDYNAKLLQLAFNLKTNGPALLKNHPLHILPLLDDAVLADGTPVAQWWAAHEARLERQRQLLCEEAKFDEEEQSQSGSLICNRCHSRSIAIQQQQTRSADEGMTVYCTCRHCGLRWKMS